MLDLFKSKNKTFSATVKGKEDKRSPGCMVTSTDQVGAAWSAELELPGQYPQLCRNQGPWRATRSDMVKKRRSGATLLGPGEFSMSKLHEGYCVVSASSL